MSSKFRTKGFSARSSFWDTISPSIYWVCTILLLPSFMELSYYDCFREAFKSLLFKQFVVKRFWKFLTSAIKFIWIFFLILSFFITNFFSFHSFASTSSLHDHIHPPFPTSTLHLLPPPRPVCPSGYSHLGDKCYIGINQRVNFDVARQSCLDIGAYLIFVVTAAEMVLVRDMQTKVIGGCLGGLLTLYTLSGLVTLRCSCHYNNIHIWIVLYFIVLYCITLYCLVFCCIVLYCIVFYCIVLYCFVLYCIVLYCIVSKKLHNVKYCSRDIT